MDGPVKDDARVEAPSALAAGASAFLKAEHDRIMDKYMAIAFVYGTDEARRRFDEEYQ